MANRDMKDVKRFVDGVSKEVGQKAYDPTEYATKEYVDETFEKKADVVEVIANPTLAGTETDLTGLLVGNTKYAVPQGVGYIDVSIDGGTLTAEQLAKVFDNGIVKEGVFFRIDNIILISSGQPREQVFNSTVINGKYYSMEVDEFTGVYTVTEVSVGGGSELDAPITINSTDFELYDDAYFGTSIGAGLYRLGIIFKNKTTNEKYCIVCNIETNPDEIDWSDPNIFNICIGFIRGGDLVLKAGGSWFTKMGVVCLYTTSSSTDTKIQMLK